MGSGRVEILLVEDNDNDAELALLAMEEHLAQPNVLRLKNGREALDFLFADGLYKYRIKEPLPKLVLLDIKMPKVDGIEVLKKIREHTSTHSLPVVILTSSQQERDLARSYELLVNSYIVKPIDYDKFNACIAYIGKYWISLNRVPGIK